MNISQKTQDWGNSTGIRLPKKVLQAVKWQHNQTVTIGIKDNAIILSPVKPTRKKPSLEDLVSGITSDNTHSGVDWGDPTGKEEW